jgi:23S rRNA pseudouridine1911/1915/1917 synthase
MGVVEGGRPSKTVYQTVEVGRKTSRVKVTLLTGRTHQIRVHMQHLGFPIVGDPLYGNGKGERQLLHAFSLSFAHPSTGELLTFEAPIPDDMRIL